jgi:hypothetical protein
MIHFEIDVQDEFSDRLEEFGKAAPRMALRICRTIGMSFRAHTKKNYMRGQIIGKRTGELYKSVKIVTDRKTRQAVIVKPWAKLANIYHNPEGATIRPRVGKMLRFVIDGEEKFAPEVHLAPRPWVPAAYRDFDWGGEIQKAADKVIAQEIRKLEKKAAAAHG